MRDSSNLSARGWAKGAQCHLAAALALAALGLLAAPAAAAPHRFSPRVVPDPIGPPPVINTTVDQSLGDCSVTCSLRDAVALSAAGATLAVPAGHYVLTLGAITINQDLTLAGAGARTTVIDGNASSGIFDLPTVLTIEIDDVSLINGNAVTVDPNFGFPAGGALDGSGTATLRRCRIANNQAALGGGIAWTGTLTIDESTIAGNTATVPIEGFSGGGILAIGGAVTMTNSTLTGNTTAGLGGGAGFLFVSPLNLLNVTVTANQASLGGGGLGLLAAGSLANSIVAGNPGGDCFLITPPLASDHNLDSDNSCGFTDAGSKPGINPLLGPLANNGGPTDTQALLAGSPAIDAGDNATCLPTDQRGVTRPQGPACDMGAFELVEAPDCSHATASPNLLWPPNHKFVPIEITGVTNPGGGPVTITVTSIFQDEPVTDGPDGTGVGTSTASVRAERDGGGDGRVYHISFTATNASGGSCTGAVTVGVPHDQGPHGGPVDEGPLYDSTQP
jgi:CSLREA domain-containing protein